MAVLKRFSYDNIVEHNPTAPDPVDYDGGGGGAVLNIDQIAYYNRESKTIAAGNVEVIKMEPLVPVPFEEFWACICNFDIRSIGNTAQVSIMSMQCFGSEVYVGIKNLSESSLTIGANAMNVSYTLLSYDIPSDTPI